MYIIYEILWTEIPDRQNENFVCACMCFFSCIFLLHFLCLSLSLFVHSLRIIFIFRFSGPILLSVIPISSFSSMLLLPLRLHCSKFTNDINLVWMNCWRVESNTNEAHHHGCECVSVLLTHLFIYFALDVYVYYTHIACT